MSNARPGPRAFSPRATLETNNAERPFADPPPPPRTPTTAADVVKAGQVPPANAWVRRAFGDGVEVNVDMVDAALRQAKEHFTRSKEGQYNMRGWPLARRLESRIGADWVPDERLPGAKAKAKAKQVKRNLIAAGKEVAAARRPPKKSRASAPDPDPAPARSPTVAPTAAVAAAAPESDVDPGNVESNIRFVGNPRKGDVYRHRTYYDGFDVVTRKGGTSISASYRCGDTVYCLPGSEDEDMYLAQIDSVFEDQGGQWVDCVWLERAKDVKTWVGTKVWRDVDALPKEVFLTLTVNTNAIQSIEGAARVMTEAEHKANAKKREKDRESGEYFVCRKALVVAPGGKKAKSGAGGGPFADVEFVKGQGFRVPPPPPKQGRKGKR